MHNYYTNDDLTNGIQSIARQLVLSDWQPDIVIGILRGGVIPAVYLSHWFEIPMHAIEWSTRDNAVGKDVDSKLFDKLVNGDNNVLIVDDICDSGLTLREVIDNLNGAAEKWAKAKKNRKLVSLKTACLHFNIGQDTFEPDYYHLEINKLEDNRWVIYPWEDF